MRFAAEIVIAAPVETVWAILADTSNYSSFDEGIARILGTPDGEGSRVIVWSMEDGDRGRVFRVTQFSPPRLMVWTEKTPFGLLRRDRTFSLEPLRGEMLFCIEQVTSGRLVRFERKREVDFTAAFERFCRGLKVMAETIKAVAGERRGS